MADRFQEPIYNLQQYGGWQNFFWNILSNFYKNGMQAKIGPEEIRSFFYFCGRIWLHFMRQLIKLISYVACWPIIGLKRCAAHRGTPYIVILALRCSDWAIFMCSPGKNRMVHWASTKLSLDANKDGLADVFNNHKSAERFSSLILSDTQIHHDMIDDT